MQVFAYVNSVITGKEMKLELLPFNLGHAFAFESGNVVQGSYVVQGKNKFEALDALRRIYSDPAYGLRFELM